MFISRAEIIDKMNYLSGRKEPFIFAIDYPGEKGFVMSPKNADNIGIRHNFCTPEKHEKKRSETPLKFDLFPVWIEAYQTAFEKVKYHLQRGDSYLLNLTFPTGVRSNYSLSGIFDISHARFKLFVPGHFVVFSPEPFVHIRDSRISCCPMKGTIDAAIPGAGLKLLADDKESFEHNTIVDLIRNDLAMVSTNVAVTRSRYLERIHTNRGDLLQMSSEISGDLPVNYTEHIGDILFALLPAGSVTGAPKEKTVEIIRSAESYERGFYTGIFGFFDGHELTSAVSIRFIEQTFDGLVFKSGGGITALSEMESEYHEMIQKIYVPVI